eukprot:214377_1
MTDEFKNNSNESRYRSVPQLQYVQSYKRNRVMIIIGATGAGKTTTINSMMNYLWNVKYHNQFRYKLIFEHNKHDQSESQTNKISIYRLAPPSLMYQLTVIDTPGFGDTRGIEYDQSITKNIGQLFQDNIDDVDAICFVIRAPQARLTST